MELTRIDLAVGNELAALERPVGLNTYQRVWLQRGGSTVEAWDLPLERTLSRHRLKGEILGSSYTDEVGHLCVPTWDEKRYIFRVYRLS